MIEPLKQLLHLAKNTDKKWVIPIVLFLVIIGILIIGAQASPVPVFIYPII